MNNNLHRHCWKQWKGIWVGGRKPWI